MGNRLYVGNLNYDTMEQDIQELFSQAGSVKDVYLVLDKTTGRSRGFAFVEMATQADAENAVRKLHGHELDGRTLTVNEARPREERSFQGGGRGRW